MISQEMKPNLNWQPGGGSEWGAMPSSADRIDIACSKQTTAALKAIAMMYDTNGEGDHRRVDTDEYVVSLIGHLSQAYLVDRGIMIKMSSTLGITDAPIARDIGLTLVNLVTICVKHSLRRRPGLIEIVAIRSSGHFRLRVSDDGNGELDPFDPAQRDAFEAVRTHAVQQDATVKVYQRPALGSSMTVTAVSGVHRRHHEANTP